MGSIANDFVGQYLISTLHVKGQGFGLASEVVTLVIARQISSGEVRFFPLHQILFEEIQS